jgi:6-methylsalicylate decarboxylase
MIKLGRGPEVAAWMGSRSRKMGIAIGNASRREFLAAASAVCTAATFAMHGDAVAEEGSKLIDTHHHFYPPAYQKAWADWEDQRKIPHLGVQLAWSRDQDIEAMDKDGAGDLVRHRRAGGARHGAIVLRFRRRKWCATSAGVMVCSRRSRCSTSTRRSKRSNMRSIRSRPTGVNLQTNYGDK